MSFFKTLRKIRSNEKGATAVEYGLIAALIAVAAIGAFISLGDESGKKWDRVETAVSEVMGG